MIDPEYLIGTYLLSKQHKGSYAPRIKSDAERKIKDEKTKRNKRAKQSRKQNRNKKNA